MPTSLDKQVGERVRRYRQAASLSVDEAADVCGLSTSDCRAREAGSIRFSTQELVQLVGALGITLSDVFGDLSLRD